MNGYILLHRKIRECRALRSAKPLSKFEAWVDLLMLANWKDEVIEIRGINVQVKRGQVGWSEVQLSKRWKWSRNKLRRWFDVLVKEKMIERLSDLVRHQNGSEMEQQNGQQNLFVTSIITITNYDRYQKTVLQDGTANETADETANGTQRIKEELKKKQKEPPVVPRGDNGKIPFSDFIKASPSRNGGKGYNPKTEAKWKKMTKDEQQAALASLSLFKECHDWTKENGQFIPMVSTFINQERWRTPPMLDAPLLQGWRVCPSCGGRGCESCNQKGKVRHGITA